MSDRETIARRRGEWVAAFNRGDLKGLEDYIADDVLVMAPNRPIVRGKAAWRAFMQEGFAAAKTRVSVSGEELEVAGDIAVDQFRWSMEITPSGGGAAVHDKGKNIWIWRRGRDGAWRHWRAIWNSDLAPAQTVWTGAASKR